MLTPPRLNRRSQQPSRRCRLRPVALAACCRPRTAHGAAGGARRAAVRSRGDGRHRIRARRRESPAVPDRRDVQAAGAPVLDLASEADCFEVMTGAVMPRGCDTVVPVEQVETADGHAEINAGCEPEPWRHVHRRGTDARAGDVLLQAGTRLAAPELAIAASAGHARTAGFPRAAHRDLHDRRRTRRTGRADPRPPGPALECLRPRRPRSRSRGSRRLRTFSFPTGRTRSIRGARFGARAARRARAFRRRLGGAVRLTCPPYSRRSAYEAAFHGIAQRPGRPMWFGSARPARRCSPCPATRCPCSFALRAMSSRRSAGWSAMPAQARAESGPGAGFHLRKAAHLFPAGHARLRSAGKDAGRAAADRRVRRLHLPRRYRRVRRVAGRAGDSCRGARRAVLSLVGHDRTNPRKPRFDRSAARGRRPARTAAARPAHLGHGPLQLPLPVLHAARDLRRGLSLPARPQSDCPSTRSRRLARAFAAEGVRKIRLTGGEPLLRTGLADLVGELSGIDGDRGPRAHDQRRPARPARRGAGGAGSLARDREPRFDRSRDIPPDERRIRRARPRAGRHPRRAPRRASRRSRSMRSSSAAINDGQVLDLARHFRGTGVVVRFIEYMDVGNRNDWRPGLVVPSRAIRDAIAAAWPLAPLAPAQPRRSRRALRLCGRRRRDRFHFVGDAAVLRRLHARAAVLRRRLLHLPVRHGGHGFPLDRCARAQATRSCAGRSARCGGGARTATANCANSPPATRGCARSRCTTLADEAKRLSHVGADGAPAMVDVSAKAPTLRVARAERDRALPARRLRRARRRRLQHRQGPGDPHRDRRRHDGREAHARTHPVLPSARPRALRHRDRAGRRRRAHRAVHGSRASPHRRRDGSADGRVGRGADVYDMCKSLSHGIVIESLRLVEKTGGKSDFAAGAAP